jgi:spermidine/putrescine transport system permease protein
LNSFLLSIKLISAPLEILFTPTAVLIGLVYTWLPFMILPLYASLEGLNPRLLEAAEDLGATPFQTFIKVTLPLTKGGLIAGSILVFIPSLGDWLVPHFLGGGKVMMAGSLVAYHFMEVGNIPVGSSLAVSLSTIVILALYVLIKVGGKGALERIV